MIPVDPKPFQKIHATLAWAIFFAVLFLCGYGYFFYLTQNTRAHVAELTAETSILEAEESQASQIKQELETTDTRRSELASYFVDVTNPVPFEETIESYGTKTNTKVNFESLEVKKNPNHLDVAFAVNGSFSDLYHFLALLESAPYEFSVTHLELQLSAPFDSVSGSKTPKYVNDWQARVALSVFSVSGVQ